jgi:rhodanese-related sulfurtransferase
MGTWGRWAAVVVSASLAAGFAQAQDPAAVPRLPLAEFRKALEAGQVVAIDVRSAEAYRNGHIPGSLLVPVDQVQARAEELRAMGKPIVTLCA